MSTGIEWTDETWNPVVGCTKVSQGCKHCYAKTIHDMRHKAYLAGKKVAPQYAHPFETVQLMPDRLDEPLRRRRPTKYFVNSVSDLFHEDVPDEYLDRVFAVMGLAERHTFQVLSKRPGRMRDYMRAVGLRERIAAAANAIMRESKTTRGFDQALSHRFLWTRCDSLDPGPWANRLAGIADDQWPLPNVWLGASVEDQKAADERIPLLLDTPAAVRFLSCEPLLGPVDLTRVGVWRDDPLSALEEIVGHVERPPVDWVIVGGESGKGARACDVAWIESIVAECGLVGVPVFVKQLGSRPEMTVTLQGGRQHTAGVRVSAKGGEMSEWPPILRVRQFPGEVAA